MSKDVETIRGALRQQLEADRMLGLKTVPMQPLRPIKRREAESERASKPAPTAGARSSPPSGSKAARLGTLDTTQVKGCKRCALHETRTQTVFGQGNPDARLLFVGEAPGFQEDRDGLAFVGPAGKLLTGMIKAMGLTRDDVFICNVLKCRPPGNRDPLADEILACTPMLWEQIAIIDPEVVVALGAPAAKTLLRTAESIGRLRGRFHEFRLSGALDAERTIPLMPTYHPAYLLRSPGEKRKAWDDLQMVMKRLGLPMPSRRGS